MQSSSSTGFWLHFESALLPEGWAQNVRIKIADRRISAIETAKPALPGDYRGGAGLPGMPNLHSHAFQRGMAGLAEQSGGSRDSFWTWRQTMYRFVERITPDDLEAIAALAYVEMLETGFTRVGEFHYLHNDADGRRFSNIAEMSALIASAAKNTGIGLTLLPVFYAHGGFGGAPLESHQQRFSNSLDSFAALLDACRTVVAVLDNAVVGVAPHSLRAVTQDELAMLTTLAGDAPIHIHIAEQMKEVDDCLAWSGKRPVSWLMDHMAVDRRWCLVHATHMDASEIARVASSGATVGLCPITEANLGDGLFDMPHYLGGDGAFGIGSDSNVLIDMREELRLLEYGQRLRDRSRNVVTKHHPSVGRSLFDGAQQGGCRALGVHGELRIGAPADIVALVRDHPAYVARSGDALLDSLVFAGGTIADVWRGGEHVVVNGTHRDRSRVAERYRASLNRLLSS